jgi:hypothetical protein
MSGGMIASFALAAALLPEPADSPAQGLAIEAEEPEIVVRAVRGKCRIRLDDRPVSERELGNRAGEWATLGIPVRVIAPDGASTKCLARIVFRLNDKGVRLIHFLDRDETP